MSMDKLFRSDEKLYISPPIDLKVFLDEAYAAEDQFHKFFGDSGTNVPQRVAFMKFMENRDYNCKQADRVINSVDNNFKRLFESHPIANFELTFPPKNSNLVSHKVLHDLRESFDTTAVKNQLVLRGKYFKYRDQELRRTFSQPGNRAAKDLICTVHLLAPLNRPPEPYENISLKNRCEVKFIVRGDMPLTKLRNKIFCASDFWSNLEDFESGYNKDAFFSNRFPSGFIFIHDTFYIDKRSNTTDISEPIRSFIDRKRHEIGPYNVRDIAETRVVDLTLRLGQPYLYQHQGACEHLIIFSDLRLLTPSDEQSVGEYPIRVFDNIHQVMCCTCRESVAVYVVTESDRMPMSPAFMCHSCFHSFHYDGKNRVGNFRAFHYTDRAGIE